MIAALDNLCTYLSGIVGAPSEQIKLILVMYAIIPLSLINYLITAPFLRLLYSLIFGLFLQFTLYGSGIIHTFISTIITYLFIKFYGRKKSAFYILIITILYLTYLHLSRMFTDYGGWTIDDPTTIYMMTICKFSSLAFSYEDGAKDDKDFKNEHHKEYKIVEKPSLLETFSYVYFYPTSVVGPSIEFKDFINFINLKGCYANLPKNLIVKQFIQYFLLSLVTMAAYAVVGPKIPVSLVGMPEFNNNSFIYKVAYLYFGLIFVRMKYYTGWTLSYSCLILCGVAYTEKKTKEGELVQSFEKGDYGSIIFSEFGVNPKFKLAFWNRTVHLWLKYNLFTRTINIDMKPLKNNMGLASLLTFLVSAIWHGYYPTYYFTFISLYLLQTGNEVLVKVGYYDYVAKRWYLTIFMSIFTQLMFDGVGVAFFNLTWGMFVNSLINLRGFYLFMIAFVYSMKYIIKVPKKVVAKKEEKKTQ